MIEETDTIKVHNTFTTDIVADAQVVVLSGRTCTGKTTISKKIEKEKGFSVIEMDTFVGEHVLSVLGIGREGIHSAIFKEVYSDEQGEYKELFKKALFSFLKNIGDDKYIFEGSLHDVSIIKEIQAIVSGGVKIVYLHPENLDKYTQRITKRFEQGICIQTSGLTGNFFNYVSERMIADFCENNVVTPEIKKQIVLFAEEVQEKSLERLEKLATHFCIDVVLV